LPTNFKSSKYMKRGQAFLFLLLFLSGAHFSTAQSSQIKKEPKKAWVENITFDKEAVPAIGQGSSYYYLLLDEQENVSTQESFAHNVYKILTNEGLQEMSDLSFEFDPAYEQLVFHSISIQRNGDVINQLPMDIRTIQREESMDRKLYDGSLTAIINLTDVRVGDIIEYSVTRKGYNPVFENYFSRWRNFNYGIPIEKFFIRLNAPSTLDLSFKHLNTLIEPKIIKQNNQISYTWEVNKTKGVLRDNHEPDWYYPYDAMLLTNFKNWGEVAKWASKRYQISEEDKKIVTRDILPKFKKTSQEEYALEAIRFVQDDIRYLGFESGLNSHKPHPPIQVFNQRFGDCKDKSLLLTTILNAKGIESYPVLVNTVYRSKLSEQLPLLGSFDHCVVQFNLSGKTFYIDPTISSQGGSLDKYYFPDYGKGLVISSTTSDLTDFPDSQKSSIHEVHSFDLSSIGGEGMLRIETTYKGSEADYQRSYYANNSLEKAQKDYITYYGNLYPDITKFDDIETSDDRDNNIFKVKEKYKISSFWKPYKDQEDKIYCEFYPLSLETYFTISKSASRTSPYRLTHPLEFSHEIHVNLPDEWPINSEKTKIESDYYEYHYQIIYENKFLSLLTNYSTKRESIAVNDFGKFADDHRKMMENLSYTLTYDKSLAVKTSNQWPGAMVTILSILIGIGLIYWLYTKYDPPSYYPPAWGIPIGGWLILIGIGISFTPLRLIYDFFKNDYMLSGAGWLSMWYSKSYGYFVFLLTEHIYNVIFLPVSILAIILFFKRRTSAPKLISIIYAASCILGIVDALLAFQMNPDATVEYKEIVFSIFRAAIWIPYLHLSQRVKKTFVNNYNVDDNTTSTIGELVPDRSIV
jgi:transglutaminase-like putative cysteine protease